MRTIRRFPHLPGSACGVLGLLLIGSAALAATPPLPEAFVPMDQIAYAEMK